MRGGNKAVYPNSVRPLDIVRAVIKEDDFSRLNIQIIKYGLKGFSKLYTFNFPDGMIGEHTFVRRYYFTCQSALKAGELVICEHPTDLIEDLALMQTLVVNFVE